jgi:transcriptional regulator with XRE-family HTH domain
VSDFGGYLKARRRDAGLSQRALAQGSGIDVSYISKLENGRMPHTPSAATLSRMAEALRVDELELFSSAGKLVGPLAGFSGRPEALEVMRVASERIESAAGWEALLDYVRGEDFSRALANSALADMSDAAEEAGHGLLE